LALSTKTNQDSLDQFQAILYTKDPTISALVNRSLREFQILPQYINDFKTLIETLNTREVHALYIDHQELIKVQHLLRDHGSISSRSCSLIVLASEECDETQLNLKGSLFQILYLKYELNAQLASSLNLTKHIFDQGLSQKSRALEFNMMKEEYEEQQTYLSQAKLEMDRMHNVSELISILSQEDIHDTHSFMKSLAEGFDRWKHLSRYGFYTLSPSTKVLKSYDLNSKRIEKLPSLSLRETHPDGIHLQAQELALQNIFEHWGTNVIMLRIEGSSQHPEILCFLDFELDEYHLEGSRYNWDLCEIAMSNLYRKLLFTRMEQGSLETQFTTIWDGFDFIDDIKEDDAQYALIDVDLSSINKFVASKPYIKFYWSRFFSDFLMNLSTVINDDSKITTFGTQHVLIVAQKSNLDEVLEKVKACTNSAEFWHYFSDIDTIVPQYINPTVRLLPNSSSLFLARTMTQGNREETKTMIYETPFKS